jgi:hypothetical protein
MTPHHGHCGHPLASSEQEIPAFDYSSGSEAALRCLFEPITRLYKPNNITPFIATNALSLFFAA